MPTYRSSLVDCVENTSTVCESPPDARRSTPAPPNGMAEPPQGRTHRSPAHDSCPDLDPARAQPVEGGSTHAQRSDTCLDELTELGDEIATLFAHVHSATERLLEMIARFDRKRGWAVGGFRSCADWLSFRTGLDAGTAREKVRVARALEGLPETKTAMACGELSFSRVRALTRVADAENEPELLEYARGSTTAELERLVRGWKRYGRMEEAAVEEARHESRTFSVFPGDDGMYVVKGRLDPEVGALLMRAVEAGVDALFTAETRNETTPAQRRADAVGLAAERALYAGFGRDSSANAEDLSMKGRETTREESATCPHEATQVPEAPTPEASTSDAPISGTRAERYQVMLHVEPETLAADGDPEKSELEDGTRVSAETSRRIACDAGVVRVERGNLGSVLDVGRRTRTVPASLRRALEVRDRGCRFPGCGLRFTDAHHVEHWADGGETKLSNMLLLCRFHHRLVHEGSWRVAWSSAGSAVFLDPEGRPHIEARQGGPDLGDRPVQELVRRNRARGVDPDGRTAGARWRRARDIPDHVYFGTREAMEAEDTDLRRF